MSGRDGGRATDGGGPPAESDADGEEEAAATDAEEKAAATDAEDGTDHLDDVADGAGCTEIWERLSERREE